MRQPGLWSRRIAPWVALSVLLSVGGAARVVAAENGDDEIPFNLRQQLEQVVKAKVSDLLSEKNAEGKTYKRGTYSKSFRKVDDSTYHVTFTQDTAGKDSLKTERFLLTLGKDASGKWSIVRQDLQDTYVGLYRAVPGDERFYHFDRFAFDHEGMKVTATDGYLYQDYRHGAVAAFVLTSADLAYTYMPPEGLDYYQLHRFNMKDYPDDFVFQPDVARVVCDPTSCSELLDSTLTGVSEVQESEISNDLRNYYEEKRKKFENELGDNPFYGFYRLYEPDRRTYTLWVRRKGGRERWNWLDYDNYEGWQVRFGFTPTDFPEIPVPVYGYYSEEARKSGADPYALEMRPDADARYYELYSIDGKVDIALEDALTLEADVTYGIRAKTDLKEIPFRISRLRGAPGEEQIVQNPTMFVNSVRDANGNELTWVRTSPYSGLVVLPEEVSAGQQFTLRMQFQNHNSIRKLNPSYSYLDRAGWLPFVRFGDMIDHFDLVVRCPSRYTAIGIGTELSNTVKDGIRTTEWTSKSPVEFPTIIFGEYFDDKSDIEVKKSDGTIVPVVAHVDKVSTHTLRDTGMINEANVDDTIKDIDSYRTGARGIRVKQLQAIADQAANSLNLYHEVYGVDYPYGKLDLVNDPVGFDFYGQAPSSIIYLGAGVFRGEGAVAASGGLFFGGGGENIAKFLKSVVAHEVGHQWWGSVVANANGRNYWFVESLAEYSAALFMENVYGRQEYLEKVDEWRDNILKFDVRTSVQNASALWGGEFPGAAYVASVYNKGPFAFHMLRMTYGDEKFFKFLKTLATDLKGREIVTRDIQHEAEKSYGVPMGWFFDQWIRGEGIPEYSFNYTTRRTEDGNYLIQGVVKQRVVVGKERNVLDGVYYLGVVPITVTSRESKKEYRVPIRVEGPESTFAFKVPEEPLEIVFNKYNEILSYDVKVNESW